MAQLTVQKPGTAGAAIAYVSAAGGGDTFDNDGETTLHVKNDGGAPITVTIPRLRNCDQGFTHDVQVTVPAGGDRLIGPFPRAEFGSPVSIAYSGVSSVTVAVFRGGS